MGRGRSGRVSQSRASQTRSHPTVTDINTYGENIGKEARTEWLLNRLNTNEAQAQLDEETVWSFTGGGFDDMHWDRNTAGNDVIDAIIDNANSPVYVGEQFRGLKIRESDMKNGVTPEQFIKNIINSGVWTEPGATSFSASSSVAESFAGWNGSHDGYISVVVKYPNATTGMPIKHLSRFSYEDEVLHSRKQMKKGYAIQQTQWLPGNKQVVITVKDR